MAFAETFKALSGIRVRRENPAASEKSGKCQPVRSEDILT